MSVSHLHTVEEVAEDPVPRFHRKRELGDDEMDITPMIDITFLLLIYFLVAAHLDNKASVELPKARYGTTVPVRESVILTIDKGEQGGSRVFRGDGLDPANEFTSINLEDREKEIIDYIKVGLAEPVSPRKRHVLIKASPTVKHREVSRVAKAVGQVEEVEQLHIAVLEGSK